MITVTNNREIFATEGASATTDVWSFGAYGKPGFAFALLTSMQPEEAIPATLSLRELTHFICVHVSHRAKVAALGNEQSSGWQMPDIIKKQRGGGEGKGIESWQHPLLHALSSRLCSFSDSLTPAVLKHYEPMQLLHSLLSQRDDDLHHDTCPPLNQPHYWMPLPPKSHPSNQVPHRCRKSVCRQTQQNMPIVNCLPTLVCTWLVYDLKHDGSSSTVKLHRFIKNRAPFAEGNPSNIWTIGQDTQRSLHMHIHIAACMPLKKKDH